MEEEGICPAASELPVAEEAEERAELRDYLRLLAKQELEALETVWDPFFAKYLEPPTTAERDVAVMEIDRKLERLRRQEETCFRQFWRLSTLLMKLQDRAEREESEVRSPESGVGGNGVEAHHDVSVQEERRAPAGNDRGAGGETAADVGPNGVRPRASADGQALEFGSPGSHAEGDGVGARTRKNASAPGDIEENKGKGNSAVMTDCPVPPADNREQAASLRSEGGIGAGRFPIPIARRAHGN